MKTALGAENSGKLRLPGKLPNPVHQERVIEREVRGTFVNSGSIVVSACLGDWI
jgi:hypothetical protein